MYHLKQSRKSQEIVYISLPQLETKLKVIMGRAPCCDKTKVKRGPWSPEEDNTLKNYVHEKHGTGGSWISLPQKAGLKRCGKSCRLRWLNYLRPNIKHGGFTQDEDNIILTLYYNIGSRWSVIASQLPGRTDNDVKNYWNTKLKKKQLATNCSSSTATATATGLQDTNCNVNSKISSDVTCPENMLPYFPMEVISQYHETMVAQIPLPGLMEVPKNTENETCGQFSYAPLSLEAVSSLSPAFSLDNNNASGREDEDAFLSELGSGLMSYDLLNDFDSHEKSGDQTNFSNFLANIPEHEEHVGN